MERLEVCELKKIDEILEFVCKYQKLDEIGQAHQISYIFPELKRQLTDMERLDKEFMLADLDMKRLEKELMGVRALKSLDELLADLLEIRHAHRTSLLQEELVCSCERARHSIKEFTNVGEYGKASDCFEVAGDALCDLQWCLEKFIPQWCLEKFFPRFVQLAGLESGPRFVQLAGLESRPLFEQLARIESELRFTTRFSWLAVGRRALISGFRSKAHGRQKILCPDRYYLPYNGDLKSILLLTLHLNCLCLDFHAAESLQRRSYKFERALTALLRRQKGLDDPTHGSACLPAGLNLDDLGEIEYLEKLGEGSYGAVYKARWSSRSAGASGTGPHSKDYSELVAVKEVSNEIHDESLEALFRISSGASQGSRSGLDNELNVLKTLNHPNIVELKGYTRKATTGKYGLVMELMKYSLGDLIKSTNLSDLVKVDTLLQVARGMHFLHKAAGIMHRDLKPANILIGDLNYLPPDARCLGYVVAKLADFGLSKGLLKQVDQADRHTFKRGTNFYMAPELRKSCNDESGSAWYAKSADVFSFGTTCFNVLTGEETPCTEPSEFYKRIKRRDVNQWLQKCGARQMRRLVRQCWCPDPNSRPPFIEICWILEEEKRRILEEENLCSEAGLPSTNRTLDAIL